jgi:CheY-like chemotaxis protein
MARILIIDDDRSLLDMVKLMVEREGHQALLAEDGQTGLEMAGTQHPDLAVVDLMMPAMSGYEVTRKLRDDPRMARMPILVLTARSQPMDEKMALGAGADAFLVKPVTTQELIDQVNALLSRRGVKTDTLLPVTTVLGLRGGSGGTTIAVNLALALTARGNNVCLVDLSPFSGHAALQLRIMSRRSWGDLLEAGEAPPRDQVERALVTHAPSGLAVLPAPQVPPRASLSAVAAASMFSILAQSYANIVVDAPSLEPATLAILYTARAIILPMSDDVLSIQTVTGALRMLEEMQIDVDRVRVVVNHVRPDEGVLASAVQRAIKRPVNLELPYEPSQQRAVSRGTPLAMAQPKCPFVQGIVRLARAI